MNQDTKYSTCTSKGHWWVSTASPLVFRCSRTGCGAMQYCIHGIWQETSPQKPKLGVLSGLVQFDLFTAVEKDAAIMKSERV